MAPNPAPGRPETDVAPIASDSIIRPRRTAWLLATAVAILILLSAASLYQQFLRTAPMLWYSAGHDRNGHYIRSQNMAFVLQRGNLAGVIREIHAATVWPPFHPLVTGLVLAVGGIDYRLAVLTSLVAWVATCWLVFALARRLVPCYKTFAGCVALLFALASPAYRAFATDIMLESLGTALTLAVLYFYVSARQERSIWRGRCFALLLMATFLTKYNYWTLLAAGLLLGTLCEFGPYFRDAIRSCLHPAAWLCWLAAQFRHPLTYPLLAACGVTLYVQFAGSFTLSWAGQQATIGRIDIPVEVAYVLLLLRLIPWWRSSGRAALDRLPSLGQQMVRWHGYPLAVWFLWPRRLGVFIWSVTFTQHGRAGDRSHWLGNFAYYWECLGRDYHANLVSLLLVLILVALAVLGRRRWTPGNTTVFVFLAAAALLTNYHSANRSRFLHSWLAVAWVAAGAGAGLAAERVAVRTRAAGLSQLSGRFSHLGPALLSATVIGLAAMQGPALAAFGHTEEAGPRLHDPSLLVLADAMLPELEKARRPVLASNEGFDPLLNWRLGEARGPGPRILIPPRDLLGPAGDDRLDGWLRQQSCDLVLVMDLPGSSSVPGFDPARLRALLTASGDFTLAGEWLAPTPDGVSAQLWRANHATLTPSLVSRSLTTGGNHSLTVEVSHP
jgi:Dolichyl-phosphate-mannose-protein mannosyltransferase